MVGVVLGGGGAAGVCHVGVLKVLEEYGIPVDCVAGTSMGSIVAGLYATGLSARELEQIVYQFRWDEILAEPATPSTSVHVSPSLGPESLWYVSPVVAR